MKKQLLNECGKYWSLSASKLYRISNTSVERTANDIYIQNDDGKIFIDCACSYGVFIVGHRNPIVQKKVHEQLKTLAWTNYGKTNLPQIELTAKLKELVPGSWGEISYFVSGAEAIEQSLRYVLKLQKHKSKIIVMSNSYHGKTLAAMNILGQKQHDYGALSNDVVFIEYGNIKELESALSNNGAKAVFIEPILGGAHLTLPPKGYLKKVEDLCKRTDTLLIADEIQTAFGRCGEMFAINYDQIEPDIIILSKGLTGGYASFACTMYSDKLIKKFPFELFEEDYKSNGGHPFGCSAALGAIEAIEKLNLVEKSKSLGAHFSSGLNAIALKYPKIIMDTPAIGLMTGLRLNGSVYEALMSMHLSKRGIHAGNSMNEKADYPVLRFYPPLTIEKNTLDYILEQIDLSLADISKISPLKIYLIQRFVKNMYSIPNILLKLLK